MPTSAQVSVTTTATVIVAASNFDQTVNLHNLGGGAIYLGGANVTTDNGYKMDNGDKITLENKANGLWAITSSGTVTMQVMAIGK